MIWHRLLNVFLNPHRKGFFVDGFHRIANSGCGADLLGCPDLHSLAFVCGVGADQRRVFFSVVV